MANEIKILSVSNDGNRFGLLLYYPIPVGTRITDPVTGSPVVVNATADLGAEELALLATAERDALDAGEAVLHRKSVTFSGGISGAQMLAEVRALYVAEQSRLLAIYEGRYTHARKQFDAS